MEPLNRQKIDDLIYHQLINDIRDGVWKIGDKLPSEPNLCKTLKVSRNTIRSAIQKLNAIGLVQTVHGKGSFILNPQQIDDISSANIVLDLTEKEFNEVNELREAIETKAAKLVFAQGTKADLTSITNSYHAMKEALYNRDIEEYTRHDYMFHMSIIVASNNDLFIQIFNIFKNLYFKYFKELNKFMFEIEGNPSVQLLTSESPYDSHTILYQYLVQGQSPDSQNSIELEDVVKTFTSGNKANFLAYLRKRASQDQNKDQ
jgi:GntR family transcriptional repressor for pyruvate dehydrogenase complex